MEEKERKPEFWEQWRRESMIKRTRSKKKEGAGEEGQRVGEVGELAGHGGGGGGAMGL